MTPTELDIATAQLTKARTDVKHWRFQTKKTPDSQKAADRLRLAEQELEQAIERRAAARKRAALVRVDWAAVASEI